MIRFKSPWTRKPIYTGVIVPDETVEKGEASFPTTWTDIDKVTLPPIILIARADDKGRPKILRTDTFEPTPEQLRDAEELKDKPAEERRANIGISVTERTFRKIIAGTEDKGTAAVKFIAADLGLRVRYLPGAVPALLLAVLTCGGVLIAGVGTLITGIIKPSVPIWLVALGCVVGASVAILTLWIAVREKTKP